MFELQAWEDRQRKKDLERVFSRKMKRELWNEVYYRIRPRDYKTYGYLTW